MVGENSTTTPDVGSVRTGDAVRRRAFRRAYRDHSTEVYSVAAGMCGAEVAGDVTREVFLHLWNHPDRYGSARSSLRTALLQVTHEVAVDTVRCEGQGQAAGRVALDELDGDEREAILSVLHGGCTCREAAAALGVDEGTIKRRIRSALDHAAGTKSDGAEPPAGRFLGGGTATTDEGLGDALDARRVVAQAQGTIMEREGKTAEAAYVTLLQLANRCRMTLPACAEDVVASVGSSGRAATPVDSAPRR